MLSLFTPYYYYYDAHPQFPISPRPFTCALICTLTFDFTSNLRSTKLKKLSLLSPHIGFHELRSPWRSGKDFGASLCCRCTHSEGDAELESELMDFMEKSGKPAMFPTKSELVEAGRLDLLEAIKTRGGWYTLGWNDNDDDVEDENVGEESVDLGELQRRIEYWKESSSLREDGDDSLSEYEEGFENLDSLQSSSSSSSSSLDGSL